MSAAQPLAPLPAGPGGEIGGPRKTPLLVNGLVVGLVALLALAILGGGPHVAKLLAPAVALIALVVGTYRQLFRWESLLGVLVVAIFFIPIKRYALPLGGAFNLEPYRVLVALIAGAWVASL